MQIYKKFFFYINKHHKSKLESFEAGREPKISGLLQLSSTEYAIEPHSIKIKFVYLIDCFYEIESL